MKDRTKPTVRRRNVLRTVAAVTVPLAAVAGGIVWYGGGAPGGGERPAPAAHGGGHVRRETRPTLDPALFVGKAAQAHTVAREIPDVLDQLYCYCHCDKSIGHKSLLSCYTDRHAAT